MYRIILAAIALAGAAVGMSYAAENIADHVISAEGQPERASALDTSSYTSIPRVFFNNAGATSYIRFSNTSGQASNFDVKVVGGESGTDYAPGKTYRVTVPDKGSAQRSIDEIRTAITSAGGPDIALHGGDTFLNLYVTSDKAGSGTGFQHVTYAGNTGFFENVSICTYDATQDYSGSNRRLVNVHTSALASYPSKIEIQNPDAVARSVRGKVYDAVTGTSVGSFTVALAANAAAAVDVSSIEQQMNFHPTSSQLHVNIEFETADSLSYTAIVGHKVQQLSSGAVFNLTQVCAVNQVRASSSCTSSPTGTNPSTASAHTADTATNPSSDGGTGSTSCAALSTVSDSLNQTFTAGQQATIPLSTLTANDIGAAGATLDAVTAFVDSGTNNSNGTYTSNATSISYTPARNGTVTFTYRLKSPTGTTSTATVTLTVGTTSNAPTAVADTLTQGFTSGQTSVIQLGTLTGNDVSAVQVVFDSITPFVDAGTTTANGTYTVSNDLITYNPARAGPVTFTYKIKSGSGTSNAAQVTLTVAQGVVVSEVPTAVDDTLTQNISVGQDTSINLSSLITNDGYSTGALFDGVTAFVDAGTSTPNGTYAAYANFIAYKAAHAGTVTFTYKIKTSKGTSNAATVTFTVTP